MPHEAFADRVDWDALRAAATDVMARAYVPYSHFPVGAAALVDDGRVVVGCNVENASYGVTLCAECSLVSALVTSGGGRLLAFTCVDGAGNVLMPCGRCRQLLVEHGGSDLLVETVRGVRAMAEVLPDAFGPQDLVTRGAGPSEEMGAQASAETGRTTSAETSAETGA